MTKLVSDLANDRNLFKLVILDESKSKCSRRSGRERTKRRVEAGSQFLGRGRFDEEGVQNLLKPVIKH